MKIPIFLLSYTLLTTLLVIGFLKISMTRKITESAFFYCMALVLFLAGNTTLAYATTLNIGTEYSSSYKIAEPTYSPEPEISSELKEQCCKFSCTAKFIIKADGKISVSLVTSSGSPEVDDIALTTLRRWRFKPATIDGNPIDSTRRIRVEFEIE
jgi:protein TonB